jgi:CRP/FNR family transcriptional regulator, transcriptional activator FtrB
MPPHEVAGFAAIGPGIAKMPVRTESGAMAGADDLVGTIPLFERLEPPLRKRIEAISEPVTVEQGEVLAHQGAMPGFLHILLEGQVALTSAMPNGVATLVTVVHPVGHFVLASVLSELPYLMTARAVMRSRLLAVDATALRHLVEREAPLASSLLRSVSHEVGCMVRQVRDLKLRSATQRLGCYLLARVSDRKARKAEFRLPFEKSLLAAQIGCRQENLSRAFAALREHGVETHGLRVILHDIPRLRAVVVPDEPNDSGAV